MHSTSDYHNMDFVVNYVKRHIFKSSCSCPYSKLLGVIWNIDRDEEKVLFFFNRGYFYLDKSGSII